MAARRDRSCASLHDHRAHRDLRGEASVCTMARRWIARCTRSSTSSSSSCRTSTRPRRRSGSTRSTGSSSRQAPTAPASSSTSCSKRARQLQVGLPPLVQTRYVNTISTEQEPNFPGDEEMEHRIRQHDPLERAGDGAARQHQLRGHRRAPLDLCQRRQPVRGRLQPLLPRAATTAAPATRSSSRATPRPASTRGPSWRGASARSSSTTSGARRGGPGRPRPRTRIRG